LIAVNPKRVDEEAMSNGGCKRAKRCTVEQEAEKGLRAARDGDVVIARLCQRLGLSPLAVNHPGGGIEPAGAPPPPRARAGPS
jgi:hypothetical protein